MPKNNPNNQNRNQNTTNTNQNTAPTSTTSTVISEKTLQEFLVLQKDLERTAGQIKSDTLAQHDLNKVIQIINQKKAILNALNNEKTGIYKSGASLLLSFERDKQATRTKLNEVTKKCKEVYDQLKADVSKQRNRG